MPLKTYLPDGDIDLSAFGRENIEDLKHVVEGEEENRAGRFVIKDVQVINAEVSFSLSLSCQCFNKILLKSVLHTWHYFHLWHILSLTMKSFDCINIGLDGSDDLA